MSIDLDRSHPIRAGLVQDPGEYPRSSYKAHAYGEEDGLTNINELYEPMSKELADRQQSYREYVL